jgi:hypothetical protein
MLRHAAIVLLCCTAVAAHGDSLTLDFPGYRFKMLGDDLSIRDGIVSMTVTSYTGDQYDLISKVELRHELLVLEDLLPGGTRRGMGRMRSSRRPAQCGLDLR